MAHILRSTFERGHVVEQQIPCPDWRVLGGGSGCSPGSETPTMSGRRLERTRDESRLPGIQGP